jgi:hypothetical protein
MEISTLSWMSFDAATVTAVVTGVIIGLLGVVAAHGAPKPTPQRAPAPRPRR